MRYCLEDESNSLALRPGETIIGRGISCDIRFNDPAISRRHARFDLQGGRLHLENLSVTNVTRLNGEAISGTRVLVNGDQIAIGRRVLRVRIIDEPDLGEELHEDNTARFAVPRTAGVDRPGADNGALLVVSNFKLGAVATPRPTAKNCHSCGAALALDAARCARCGETLTHHRVLAQTQELALVLEELERRGQPRRLIHIPVLYTGEALTFESQTQDLSKEGVFINSLVAEKVGTPCHVTLLPDGQPPLSLIGVVSRVVAKADARGDQPAGMGIRFSKMSEAVHRWICGALKRCP